MPYQPDAAFAGLFRAFTSKPDSIGTLLTDLMKDRSADAPLLVSTASDIARIWDYDLRRCALSGGMKRFRQFGGAEHVRHALEVV
jgi:hypothetical protein